MAEAAEQQGSANKAPIQVKLVLLGEAAVGKSSCVMRFVQNDFQENKEPTIGAAFLTQKCKLDDKTIKFEIWDTAGQERFHSLAPMYYRNAAAAVVVYDVTSSSSLEKAKSWVKELQRQANPNIVIAFIGNKVDLVQPSTSTEADDSNNTITPSSGSGDESDGSEADDATATPSNKPSAAKERQVMKEDVAAYAEESNLLFFETSAKTGEGIVEVFTEIAHKIPISDILAQGRGSNARGGGGRNAASAAGGQANNGRVQLGQDSAEGKKDNCAC